MCRILGVSPSGYYAWVSRPISCRERANFALASEIKAIYEAEHQRVGSIRITKRLQAKNIKANRKRVVKIMQLNGWRAKGSRKFKATTNSNHSLPVAPNLLEKNFSATKPNEKWVSDITYIATQEGWLYLAVVMDLYSRAVIGWSLSSRMTSQLVCDALTMALWRRKKPKDVIVHSDRGSQYCSKAYRTLLTSSNLVCSMSKRGDCYDNAMAESFFATLESELLNIVPLFANPEEAKREIFRFIEGFYNEKRLQ